MRNQLVHHFSATSDIAVHIMFCGPHFSAIYDFSSTTSNFYILMFFPWFFNFVFYAHHPKTKKIHWFSLNFTIILVTLGEIRKLERCRTLPECFENALLFHIIESLLKACLEAGPQGDGRHTLVCWCLNWSSPLRDEKLDMSSWFIRTYCLISALT